MNSFRYLLTALAIALIALSSCSKHKRPSRHNGEAPYKPEWVDMGTVVNGKKVYWATCNLGARNPWEYGNYYAWGELKPKDSYTKENYTYKDTPATLPLTADAANKAYGGKWRIPTKADFSALFHLLSNDDFTFDLMGTLKNQNGEDVKGVKITQKATGTVLFLPAAGYYEGERFRHPGYEGQYWASEFSRTFEGQPEAYASWFCEGDCNMNSYNTFCGLSIRPVCDE